MNVLTKAIGSNGCFYLARNVLRPSVERKMAAHSSKLAKLDEALALSQYKERRINIHAPRPSSCLCVRMAKRRIAIVFLMPQDAHHTALTLFLCTDRQRCYLVGSHSHIPCSTTGWGFVPYRPSIHTPCDYLHAIQPCMTMTLYRSTTVPILSRTTRPNFLCLA